ncbi:hypothetical protein EXW45_05425 [Bacillus wiedmannii]|nr:hypothetical protein DN394_17070 [Bacillus sp. BB081]QWH70844.1 hypothetical protein EXW45_05425 [Bacillus wiedmannii]
MITFFMVKWKPDGSPIHIIKIKVVQVGGRHLRVSFLYGMNNKNYDIIELSKHICVQWNWLTIADDDWLTNYFIFRFLYYS